VPSINRLKNLANSSDKANVALPERRVRILIVRMINTDDCCRCEGFGSEDNCQIVAAAMSTEQIHHTVSILFTHRASDCKP